MIHILKSVRSFASMFALSVSLVAFGGAFIGCDDEPDDAGEAMEKAGDNIEKSAEKAGDKVEDAAEKVEDKTKDAADKVEDKTKEAADNVTPK